MLIKITWRDTREVLSEYNDANLCKNECDFWHVEKTTNGLHYRAEPMI